VQLVMPRLGEAVEVANIERVFPWWREVAAEPNVRAPAPEEAEGEEAMVMEPID
jgi:hypothetical protein